ncbi:4-(cytidine 5'-diphospho)-2-C-methyl-D-erythritol kinase [Qipengyuania sp. DSG2-2]|uniref:4-(cytidine 5'-diphospho)-2-C-methyl-D-erythritol kinase n=1 Tax=Qipengyuania sp. DGS2-2 TaxID=3349631 RepID=UPI0036D31B3F
MPVIETAYAKINLALHIQRRRDDGYHELETLFAFVDAGDTLTARAAEADRLQVRGEFVDALDDPFDNLVMKALTKLPRPGGIELLLEKNLPVAAGLGGGSADAGAVFRVVRDMHGLPDDWHTRAAKLGADVPACVDSVTCIGRGTGTELAPIKNDLAGTPVLLVNPRVMIFTPQVFTEWKGIGGGPLKGETAREIAMSGGNDLQKIVTEDLQILEVILALNSLSDTNPVLHRMSGSGATCFALYETNEARDDALREINTRHPEWWTLTGNLR